MFWKIVVGGAASIMLGAAIILFEDELINQFRVMSAPSFRDKLKNELPFFKRCVVGLGQSFIPGHHSRSCLSQVSGNARLSYEYFEGPFGPVPATVIAPKKVRAAPKLVVINLIGGPSGAISFDFVNDYYPRFMLMEATKDTVFVTPAYLGSELRTVYPLPDVLLALDEIRVLVKLVSKEYPTSRICLIGASLGGYLGVRLSDTMPDVRMLLVNPAFGSPKSVAEMDKARLGETISRHYRKLNRYELQDQRLIPTKQTFDPVPEVFQAFFGPDFNKELLDLTNYTSSAITVLYSPTDPRVNHKSLYRFKKKWPQVKVVTSRPAGHEMYSADNFYAYKNTMSEFLSECRARS